MPSILPEVQQDVLHLRSMKKQNIQTTPNTRDRDIHDIQQENGGDGPHTNTKDMKSIDVVILKLLILIA